MTYVEVAMKIILHAGDAQLYATNAFSAIEKNQFNEAEQHVNEAIKEITLAHQAQTTLIQTEAGGEKSDSSLLFAHAQDTLMTVKMEIEIIKRMINTFRQLDERLRKVEGKI